MDPAASEVAGAVVIVLAEVEPIPAVAVGVRIAAAAGREIAGVGVVWISEASRRAGSTGASLGVFRGLFHELSLSLLQATNSPLSASTAAIAGTRTS